MRHRIVALFAVFLATTTAGAAGFADLARAIDAPRVGPPVRLAGPLRAGSATVEPAEGTPVRLLLAGDEPCGVLLAGRATLVYRIANRFSRPVAARNLRRASSLESTAEDDALVIREELEGAAVWGWEVARGLEPVADGKGAPDLPRWLTRTLDRPIFAPPSHELLQARFLGIPGTVVALLEGKHERLLLEVDPGVERLERLSLLDRVPSADPLDGGRAYPVELAARPVGRRWWDRFPAPLVATAERLEVTNDRDEHVTVRAELELIATRAGVRLWRADLVERMRKRNHETPVTVRSVTVDGKPAPFLHGANELLVRLPSAPPPRGTVRVTVELEGNLAQRPGNDSYWALGTWPWYPQPPWNGELARTEITVHVPEGWEPFATGDTVSRTTEGGTTTLVTRCDWPVQFPVVAAGRYHVVHEEHDGVRINVAAYVFGKERACRRLARNFAAAAELYGKLFHEPYPFREMDIVEINQWGWGQAPPGVIFITREAYNPLGDTVSQLFSQGVNERFVHEVAHTWWAHVVKMDSPEEQWLTESFAEYSAAVCLQAVAPSPRKGKRLFRKILDGWIAGARAVGDGGSIYLANHLAMRREEDVLDRQRLLYHKGPLVLHALRLALEKRRGEKEGDRIFFTLLRSFVRNFEFGWGATRHLVGILDQITGEDWQPWFERYVYGCEMPPLPRR